MIDVRFLRSFSVRLVLVTICAAASVVAGAWSDAASAGTLPNITGTWYANGDPSAPCQISQSGTSVSLSNQQGNAASGQFVDPSTLSTDWGPMNGGRITGTISDDLRRISWSNGTFWSRPNVAPIGPAPTPAPTTPTPAPLRISTHVTGNAASPVYVYRASLANGRDFRYMQCVSFRNVSTKVVKAVDFSFVVWNYLGAIETKFDWTDKGTFTAPIGIDGHCFDGQLWAAVVVRRMNREVVRVKRVTFADGTTWRPGKPFLRGFTRDGTALAAPTIQPGVPPRAEGGSSAD